jgi:anion-transporting  ArsA/GET3 family ATPase
LKSLLPLRAVLVTGKGGVGKTTLTASLARYAAAQGKRVLCAEMVGDSAASSALSSALGIDHLDVEPVAVAPNLNAVLLAPHLGHTRFLRDVLPMRILADAAMRSAAIRRFLAAAPTFPEMGVLYRLLDLVRAKRRDGTDEHEMIIVDLPATGHALALAQIPASLLRIIPSGPIAAAVREGLDLLMDAERTGAVVVTLPETLPISEALELCKGIRLHDIPLAQVFVNRVPLDPFTDEEREAVRRMLHGRAPTLGERTMERIDRARVSLARLQREVPVPIAALEDVSREGPGLAEEIASRMAVEGAA